MRSLLLVLPFVVLTFLCWGNYGPLMHEGQHYMEGGRLRPFICVGLAYFLIAVVVPTFVLGSRGESGRWTVSGAVWSLAAGAVGAIGALGIIMAFNFRGSPVYVMPLVFGLAPVVNTLVSGLMAGNLKEANGIFYAGVLVVALGAAGVMFFKPSASNIHIDELNDGAIKVTKTDLKTGDQQSWTAKSLEDLQSNSDLAAANKLYLRKKGPGPTEFLVVLASIGVTALCWGSYGPVLHKGQAKMSGSRLRPFLCVGLAYFVVAVCAPGVILGIAPEPGGWTPYGVLWSMGAGAAGAVGALGIILAFNFGGKPVFVMPLVFGFAPVVNTFTTLTVESTFAYVTTPFYVSLALVILGAVTVLRNAPKPTPKPAADQSAPAAFAERETAADETGGSPIESKANS